MRPPRAHVGVRVRMCDCMRARAPRSCVRMCAHVCTCVRMCGRAFGLFNSALITSSLLCDRPAMAHFSPGGATSSKYLKCVRVCVRVCECVRVCVRACVRECVCVCKYEHVCVYLCVWCKSCVGTWRQASR